MQQAMASFSQILDAIGVLVRHASPPEPTTLLTVNLDFDLMAGGQELGDGNNFTFRHVLIARHVDPGTREDHVMRRLRAVMPADLMKYVGVNVYTAAP